MYPPVVELAADGIPVAVTCRVLKLASRSTAGSHARSPIGIATRCTARTRC